jgi:MFS family permease
VFVGVLKYAYGRDGTGATGLVSIALLLPYVLAAPIAGSLAERLPPNRVRLAGLVVQAAGYGVSGALALADLPTVWVVAPAMVAVGAVTTLRPTGAVLLPAIVRSTRELTVGNLWTGYAETAGGLAGPRSRRRCSRSATPRS